jgi:hypothetical protein
MLFQPSRRTARAGTPNRRCWQAPARALWKALDAAAAGHPQDYLDCRRSHAMKRLAAWILVPLIVLGGGERCGRAID